MEKNKIKYIIFIAVVLIITYLFNVAYDQIQSDLADLTDLEYETTENSLKIISSSENQDLENIIKTYARENDIEIEIEYAGTLEIMEKLNSGEEYDAVWCSNSVWLYMLDDSVEISESKSTSINPVIFAIKESKARELGFIDRDIYTKDIVEAIKNGSLKFSMSNPTQTNSGATAYLGLLSTLAGNPEVLNTTHLEDEYVKQELVSLFNGMERSSGSESFLEELFLKGSYEAVVTYESSIININNQLERNNQETLYALYPIDGVSISDSPLAYIDNGNDDKKELFLNFRNYILSDEGQELLAQTGRRTWFGGVNEKVDKDIFNPDWGIDTSKYIVPIKFPNTKIIQDALSLYQAELRKPIHTVFCLDYSGSMYGEGNQELTDAMKYILTQEEAQKDLLQFTEKDKITVIPFSTNVISTWQTTDGTNTQDILTNILNLEPTGSTNIYDTSIEALEILNQEDGNTYNLSIILMTDGLSNMGSYSDLSYEYRKMGKEIPIYSIMFGNAYENELEYIAELTNAKVFDGKTDLLKAFKEVRGYN
ncbi:MAG: VWA domain-containing protein [Clostridia bacterium]|nr:VWA domain-containing protein [Clostridia bacterium]